MADQLPKLAHASTEPEAQRLLAYIQAALAQAVYEELADDGSVYGEIPGFQGVWANAPTQEACQIELAEVLEGWLTLCLEWQRPIPVVNGIDLMRATAA